jgi:beta-phosphoglucomutase-like phosphatase (HAD superfamily)
MTISAVLFDMDGTLVDSEPTHYDALVAAVDRHGQTVPDGFAEQITGMSIADCHTALVESIGLTLSLEDFVVAKHAAYLALAPGLKRREGVDPAFDMLARNRIPYAIVSNSDRMIADANLRATSLSRPGLVSVTRSDVRQGKPDPEPYLRAAHLLGVRALDCVVIEDSAVGAQAGLAAGMQVIAWPEPHRDDLVFPAGCLIADPFDLTAALNRLLTSHTINIA